MLRTSKASMHINTRGSDVIVFFRICTISGTRRLRPPNSFLAFRKASRIYPGIPPLLESCLRMAPNIFVVDCSCWARKSQSLVLIGGGVFTLWPRKDNRKEKG